MRVEELNDRLEKSAIILGQCLDTLEEIIGDKEAMDIIERDTRVIERLYAEIFTAKNTVRMLSYRIRRHMEV